VPPAGRGALEISPELAALVDELSRQHPSFRRATIEKLVLRTVREVAEGDLPAVHEIADEQLTYVDEGSAEPLRRGR